MKIRERNQLNKLPNKICLVNIRGPSGCLDSICWPYYFRLALFREATVHVLLVPQMQSQENFIRWVPRLLSLRWHHSFLPHNDPRVPSRTARTLGPFHGTRIDWNRCGKCFTSWQKQEAKWSCVGCDFLTQHGFIKSCKNVACYEPILSLRVFTATFPSIQSLLRYCKSNGSWETTPWRETGTLLFEECSCGISWDDRAKQLCFFFFFLTTFKGFHTSPCISA